jgi:hypothetical protein
MSINHTNAGRDALQWCGVGEGSKLQIRDRSRSTRIHARFGGSHSRAHNLSTARSDRSAAHDNDSCRRVRKKSRSRTTGIDALFLGGDDWRDDCASSELPRSSLHIPPQGMPLARFDCGCILHGSSSCLLCGTLFRSPRIRVVADPNAPLVCVAAELHLSPAFSSRCRIRVAGLSGGIAAHASTDAMANEKLSHTRAMCMGIVAIPSHSREQASLESAREVHGSERNELSGMFCIGVVASLPRLTRSDPCTLPPSTAACFARVPFGCDGRGSSLRQRAHCDGCNRDVGI